MILVLVLTFILSSIFKTAFWLKIPIGCFLLVLGALSHDIYQTKGLITFAVVFALPYILPNKNTALNFVSNFSRRRKNKEINLNFEIPCLLAVKVTDNGYNVSADGYSINEITVDKKHGYFSSVGIEILAAAYGQRSLFIAPILFLSLIGLNHFLGGNLEESIGGFFGSMYIGTAVMFSFLAIVFIIELFSVLTTYEFEVFVNRVGDKAIENRKGILEKEAIKEFEKLFAERGRKIEHDLKNKALEDEKKESSKLIESIATEHQNSSQKIDNLIDLAKKVRDK